MADQKELDQLAEAEYLHLQRQVIILFNIYFS